MTHCVTRIKYLEMKLKIAATLFSVSLIHSSAFAEVEWNPEIRKILRDVRAEEKKARDEQKDTPFELHRWSGAGVAVGGLTLAKKSKNRWLKRSGKTIAIGGLSWAGWSFHAEEVYETKIGTAHYGSLGLSGFDNLERAVKILRATIVVPEGAAEVDESNFNRAEGEEIRGSLMEILHNAYADESPEDVAKKFCAELYAVVSRTAKNIDETSTPQNWVREFNQRFAANAPAFAQACQEQTLKALTVLSP